MQRLAALQEEISLARNREWVDQELDVLIEGTGDGISAGRSYRDAPEIDGLVLLDEVLEEGALIPRQGYRRVDPRSDRKESIEKAAIAPLFSSFIHLQQYPQALSLPVSLQWLFLPLVPSSIGTSVSFDDCGGFFRRRMADAVGLVKGGLQIVGGGHGQRQRVLVRGAAFVAFIHELVAIFN